MKRRYPIFCLILTVLLTGCTLGDHGGGGDTQETEASVPEVASEVEAEPAEESGPAVTDPDLSENEESAEAASSDDAEEWIVRMYANDAGSQMMSFSVTDTKGRLILIDGGIDQNDADWIRDIIREHNDHVDAWIITHSHPDHCNAFNLLMDREDPGFEIDQIYTVEYNTERYRETAQEWDKFESHEKFVSIVEGLPNLTFLHENDEIDLIGLHMKVLHAWDEEVSALDHQMCNNGSLVFRLDGKEDSMLFLSDLEVDMEEALISRHKDELKADYVQCAHHANWGLPPEFYDLVEAKEAFFSGPVWLYEESDTYDGYLLKQYFEEKGAKIHLFTDAPPREVILR